MEDNKPSRGRFALGITSICCTGGCLLLSALHSVLSVLLLILSPFLMILIAAIIMALFVGSAYILEPILVDESIVFLFGGIYILLLISIPWIAVGIMPVFFDLPRLMYAYLSPISFVTAIKGLVGVVQKSKKPKTPAAFELISGTSCIAINIYMFLFSVIQCIFLTLLLIAYISIFLTILLT